MAEPLQIRYQDATLTLATLGPLVVTIATGPSTLPQVVRMRELVRDIQHGLNGVKTCGVSLMKMSAGDVQMDPEVRKQLTAMMDESRDSTAATALVFEGNNLLTMALRAAVSVLLVASRSKFPNKVCGNAEEAMDWVTDYVQPGLDSAARLHYRRSVVELYDQVKEASGRRIA